MSSLFIFVMTKPTLLICPGIPKAGTTAISQHLLDSKYFHYGFDKEMHYFFLIYAKINRVYGSKYLFRYREFISKKNHKFYKEYQNFTQHNSYFDNKFSIESYINFYLELHNYTGMMPMDFAQNIVNLPQDFLQECNQELSKHFNVKILLCYRDPIKRLFSDIHKDRYYYSKYFIVNMQARSQDAKKIFYHKINLPDIHSLYTDVYTKFKTIFGKENVSYVIFEKYFDSSNDLERKKLFDFLNIPFQDIDISKYHNKSNYKETLTQEDITFAKDNLKDAYTLWQEVIGELPSEWI